MSAFNSGKVRGPPDWARAGAASANSRARASGSRNVRRFMTFSRSARADHKPKGGSAPCDRRVLSILDGPMHFEPKSLSRTGGIPEESRRGPEPERDAETRESPPF